MTLRRVAYANAARAFAAVEDHTTLLQIGQPDVAEYIQNKSAIQPSVLAAGTAACLNLKEAQQFMQTSAALGSPATAWDPQEDVGGGGICMNIATATMGALLCYQDDWIKNKKLQTECNMNSIVDACKLVYFPAVGHYAVVCKWLLIDFTIGQFTRNHHYETYIDTFSELKKTRPILAQKMKKPQVNAMIPPPRGPTAMTGGFFFEEWIANGCGYYGGVKQDMAAVKHIAQDSSDSCDCKRIFKLYNSAKRDKVRKVGAW